MRKVYKVVAFEFDGSKEEECGEGAIKDGAWPWGIGDPNGSASIGVVAVNNDCCEPDSGGEKKDRANGSGQAVLAVELEQDAAGDKFECGGTDEELNYGGRREADVEFESDDGDAP